MKIGINYEIQTLKKSLKSMVWTQLLYLKVLSKNGLIRFDSCYPQPKTLEKSRVLNFVLHI